MSALTVVQKNQVSQAVKDEDKTPWLIIRIGKQYLAISVQHVQGVLRHWQLAPIPLARPEVVGAMNLRGRIVTVLDLGLCLGFPARTEADWKMGVIVEEKGFLYCLMVDEVGEVMPLPSAKVEAAPGNLLPAMKQHTQGVYRLEKGLLVLLNLSTVLHYA